MLINTKRIQSTLGRQIQLSTPEQEAEYDLSVDLLVIPKMWIILINIAK